MIVNELCSWAKVNGNKMLLFKADFNKAFDSINWVYLDSMMEQMGFRSKWRSWISGRLRSGRASVIINGSPTNEFSLNWTAPLGCDPSTIPFTYLGIPVGENMNLRNAWRPIIDKFHAKLTIWKARSLSFGGRVTLQKMYLGIFQHSICLSLWFLME